MKFLLLALLAVSAYSAVRGEDGGYGAPTAPPPPPPTQMPYDDPIEKAADQMETMEETEPADEEAAGYTDDEPAPDDEEPDEEPIPDDEYATTAAPEPEPEPEPEMTTAAPEPEPTTAAQMDDPAPAPEEETPADDGYGADAPPPPPPPPGPDPPAPEPPMPEPPTTAAPEPEPTTPATDEQDDEETIDEGPADEGGYRSALKNMRRRVINLRDVRETDQFLAFDRDCSDHHKLCRWWASIRKGSRHPLTGERVQKSECFRNRFLATREGCPYACGICTANRREWGLRRRLALRKRALRLAKSAKNL